MDVKIALLAGDGIGPEIVAEATKVLDRVAEKFGHKIEYRPALVGAAAIDAVGDPYPDETHAVCLAADAVLFGAIGDPKYDIVSFTTILPSVSLSGTTRTEPDPASQFRSMAFTSLASISK